MLRLVKNRLQEAVPAAFFLTVTVYFVWNALHGARGLEAQQVQRAQLAKAGQQFAAVDAARNQWETRITDLSDPSIGQDMLDDQARIVLNLANPSDLVVQLPAFKNH